MFKRIEEEEEEEKVKEGENEEDEENMHLLRYYLRKHLDSSPSNKMYNIFSF